MKEILELNYYIKEDIDIIEENNYIYFILNDKRYYFMPYLRSDIEFNDLYELNEELILKGIPTGKFVINKNNQFITTYSENKYVLIEMPLSVSKEYSTIDMAALADKLKVSNKNSLLYRNNWVELWSSKVDYFEYQVSELGRDLPVVLNSFSYYVGLAENAISYVSNTIHNYQISILEHITLQRKRINFPNIYLEYFNPLNYVIDIEVRDIATYFKSLFFNSYDDLWFEVNAYFKRKKLSIYGYQLLYARLLFPSYYFDIYEKVVDKTLKEEELVKVIKKADSYEKFLSDIYNVILKYAKIEEVSWLKKETIK
jgi:spore coat protein YutH